MTSASSPCLHTKSPQTLMQLIITSRNEIHMTVIDYYKGLYLEKSRILLDDSFKELI